MPEGWIVEFKTRNGGVHAGRQDKVFLAQAKLIKLNLMKLIWCLAVIVVLAFVCLFYPCHRNDCESKKIIRMVLQYFIDPSTGYKFNSLTKVWNYLKTNEEGSGKSSTKHFLEKVEISFLFYSLFALSLLDRQFCWTLTICMLNELVIYLFLMIHNFTSC